MSCRCLSEIGAGSGMGSALDGLTSLASQQGLTVGTGENLDVSFLVTVHFLIPGQASFEKGAALKEQVEEQVKERVDRRLMRLSRMLRKK